MTHPTIDLFEQRAALLDRKPSINHALARDAEVGTRSAVYGPTSSMFQGSSASYSSAVCANGSFLNSATR
jgi:hypothetical protein